MVTHIFDSFFSIKIKINCLKIYQKKTLYEKKVFNRSNGRYYLFSDGGGCTLNRLNQRFMIRIHESHQLIKLYRYVYDVENIKMDDQKQGQHSLN